MTFSEKIYLFTKPLSADQVEWRPGQSNRNGDKTRVLAYIDNRAVLNRLDNIFGPEHWRNELQAVPDGFIAGLSLQLDDGSWITKWDGAGLTSFEAVKGGISDAQKRAAHQWGLGRELYNYPTVWISHYEGDEGLPSWRLEDSVIQDKLRRIVKAVTDNKYEPLYFLDFSKPTKLPPLTVAVIKEKYEQALKKRFEEGTTFQEAIEGFQIRNHVTEEARAYIAKIAGVVDTGGDVHQE